MALPVTIPNTFANATASIPLSQLDTNFTTLANAVNGISDGSETLANVTATVVNATTVDTTNIEVTNIKAKDGTAAGSIADSTGVVTLASSVLTTTDINGGTIDGTAIGGSTPAAVSATTLNTSGAVVFNDAGADVDFRVEGDTDANLLFVDASADAVGIGTSAPGCELHVNDSVNDNVFLLLTQATTGSTFGSDGLLIGIDANEDAIFANYENTNMIFRTNATERMRIDSSGNVTVGSTANFGKLGVVQTSTSATNIRAENGQTSVTGINFYSTFTGPSNDNTTAIHFAGYAVNGIKFTVYGNGNVVNTNNSYGPISDVKLKQDIVDAGSQWDDLKAIRIRKFRFKDDLDGVLQIGVIAQEIEEVSPGLVSEHPDYEMVEVPVLDDEGNPVLDDEGNPTTRQEQQATGETTKSVKATVLYMKAVKALQEAMERIETLEASNTALEARITALETGV